MERDRGEGRRTDGGFLGHCCGWRWGLRPMEDVTHEAGLAVG